MRTKSEKKNVEGENWKKKQIKKMIKKKMSTIFDIKTKQNQMKNDKIKI
jgi:hypothetical protein